jgi:lysophospholipase L1-like esterase
LLCGATVFSLLLAEVLARVALAPVPLMFGQPVGETAQEAERGPGYEAVLENDPELFFRLRPSVRLADEGAFRGVVSNARRVRVAHEIPLEKDPGEVRILFLGDSATFGWMLRHDETFVYFAEEELRSRFPGVLILCINAGVPGYTAFQGWRFLETEGFGFEPDLVVVNFGFNEMASWGGLGDFEQYELWKSLHPPGLLARSRVLQLLWRLKLLRDAPYVGAPRPRLQPEEFRAVLARIEAATSARGVDLLVLVPALRLNVDGTKPNTYRRPNQRELERFGEGIRFGPGGGRGLVDCVPLVQALRETHPPSDLFLDHVHPTRLTNQAVAKAIADKVALWLLPRMRE